ncbi:lipid-A-disaccharide synthase N-terminal domain-containing protein [Hoylesella buccalis]|uniref:lipid-A-disaccharide synthase N-terminal domain-containing protein n=1 Tax=Hoylesella buccalis TaxID=28127 RepID=UPI0035AC1434
MYQWYYSYRRHASLLPLGFWIISLIGSCTIVIYGIIRRNPVSILGQSFGFVAYVRNIVLLSRQRKSGDQ